MLERAGARAARGRRSTSARPGHRLGPGRRSPTSYAAWPTWPTRLVGGEPARHDDEDEAAFAARFQLVHEWRKFLFADPGLPAELLPADWPGHAAADAVRRRGERLKPGRGPVRRPLPGR